MRYRILVVDNDPNVLKAIRLFLKEDYEVFAVSNGEDALRFFEKKSVDLILLDMHMPGMSGQETFLQIREKPKAAGIPVIFLTGEKTEQEWQSCTFGAADYLAKPVEMGTLRRRVAYHIQTERARKLAVERDDPEQDQENGRTGMLTAAAFQEKVGLRLAEGAAGAMMVLDIDDLSNINATYGYAAGDQILRQITEIFETCIHANSLFGRLSGDEFAVFLPNMQDKSCVTRWAEEIVHQVPMRVVLPDTSCCVSVSVGISLYGQGAETYLSLFQRADSALLYAKEHGKNGYHVFHQDDSFCVCASHRTDMTYDSINKLLQGYETSQRRIKFGEYRFLWQGAVRLARCYGFPAISILFTLETVDGRGINKDEVGTIQAQLSAQLCQNFRGVFAWYSTNQMLWLITGQEDVGQMIQMVQQELSDTLDSLQIRLTCDTLRADEVTEDGNQ